MLFSRTCLFKTMFFKTMVFLEHTFLRTCIFQNMLFSEHIYFWTCFSKMALNLIQYDPFFRTYFLPTCFSKMAFSKFGPVWPSRNQIWSYLPKRYKFATLLTKGNKAFFRTAWAELAVKNCIGCPFWDTCYYFYTNWTIGKM